MKNRLLEDIGDSQSGPSALAERRVRPAAPPPEPLDPPAPSGPAPQPRARAAVWRSRATLPPSPAADLAGHDTPAPPESPASAPPPRAAGIAPWPASFSSREPDWPIPPPSEPAPWLDRWGRKALGWTVAAAAVVAVAGAATWMYRDTQVQSTLAVVAGNSPAKTATALPAAAPPVVDTAPPWTPPPLRMLPPPPVAETPASPAPAVAAAPVADAPGMAEQPAAVAPRATAAPKARRAPERRVAAAPVKKKPERRVAAAPPRKARAAPDLSWAARERERLLAQTRAPDAGATARPAKPPAQPEPQAPPGQQAGAGGPLSETLRLCRAAGYHAAACMKRGCEATRFGLVCRG